MLSLANSYISFIDLQPSCDVWLEAPGLGDLLECPVSLETPGVDSVWLIGTLADQDPECRQAIRNSGHVAGARGLCKAQSLPHHLCHEDFLMAILDLQDGEIGGGREPENVPTSRPF